jgi:GTP-binding protein
MFIDEAKICVVAGRGGHGRVGFKPVGKSPYKKRPNGGSGGWGGDVYLKCVGRMRTLLTLTNQIHWKADSGANGGNNSRTGKSGKQLIVNVPVGTVVRDLYTQEVLVDFKKPGEKYLVARGGLGGRGNEAFLSNYFKSPRISELGERGEEVWLTMELKMLADVGLIGFPNAGKSTLITRISSAQPKIGAYPFTTLEPKLGMVQVGNDEFVAVDIPGLIEGAHEGKGLGARFLKHVERARVLVHLVDLSADMFEDGRNPLDEFHKINNELEAFSPILADKPQIVIGTKSDLLDDETIQVYVDQFKAAGITMLPISSATGQGIDDLIRQCLEQVKALDESDMIVGDVVERIYTLDEEPAPWTIVDVEDGVYMIQGPKVRRLGLLRLNTEDGMSYFHFQLERLGIFEGLINYGARPGDTIIIGENTFEFSDEPMPKI